jgi:hypothetical protein
MIGWCRRTWDRLTLLLALGFWAFGVAGVLALVGGSAASAAR